MHEKSGQHGSTHADPAHAPSRRVSRVCVCVSADGAGPPDALRATMEQKGLRVEVAPTALEAFSMVLLGGAGTILLVVEPGRAAWVDRLSRAVERYAPRATAWCWRAEGSPQLGPLVAKRSTPAPAQSTPVRTTPAPSKASPAGESSLLRLVDGGNGHPQNGVPAGPAGAGGTNGKPSSHVPRQEGVLDADELAMLLGERVRRAEGGLSS